MVMLDIRVSADNVLKSFPHSPTTAKYASALIRLVKNELQQDAVGYSVFFLGTLLSRSIYCFQIDFDFILGVFKIENLCFSGKKVFE